jgi:hypothetical protein
MLRFFKSLSIVIIIGVSLVPAASNAGINDILKGWGWDGGGQAAGPAPAPYSFFGNGGWVSANATNCIGNPSCAVGADYGVTVSAAGNVTGYAWSANFGWICFGTSCAGDPPGVPATSWATFSSVTGDLSGWARFVSMAGLPGVQGWISLNCTNTQGSPCPALTSYKVTADLASGFLSGYGWNCSAVAAGACSGANYAGGIGWVKFGYNGPPAYQQVGAVPYLQVLRGDIYAKSNINAPTPFTSLFNKANATYCIDKGGALTTVTNFVAGGLCGNAPYATNFNLNQNINFPSRTTNYRTSLGFIDLPGITGGRYGTVVTQPDPGTLPALLGGAVYATPSTTPSTPYATYVLTGRTFSNGTGTQNGAGLLLVYGNLNITGNLLYDAGAVTRLRQLASFGIIVLDDPATPGVEGNVTISSGVTTVGANIYAEGTINTSTTGNPNTDVALTINGVLVAHQLYLRRQVATGANIPSETVIYDGRVVANTPPGMSDFSQALPKLGF